MKMQTVAAALAALRDANGRLSARDVVEAAREPSHPLHSQFEWDDTVAGAAYRLDQARALIRSIRVRVTETALVVRTPTYVPDPNADEGYIALSSARSAPELSREILASEIDRAQAAVHRVERIATSLGFKPDFGDFTDRLDALRRAARRQPPRPPAN